MNLQNKNENKIYRTKAVSRFLGGLVLGGIVIALPLSYGASIDFNFVQTSALVVIMLSCGLLSSLWGENFVDAVMKLLNGTGL